MKREILSWCIQKSFWEKKNEGIFFVLGSSPRTWDRLHASYVPAKDGKECHLFMTKFEFLITRCKLEIVQGSWKSLNSRLVDFSLILKKIQINPKKIKA